MYKILRNILFFFDPEWVHYFSMNSLVMICRVSWIKKIIIQMFVPGGNNKFTIFNIQFPNRIGLAAGFDKNAKYLNELEALGFGFVEIGTVTPLPQDGNERPRLFRLPKDKALINRMGFNNDGVVVVAERLKKWRTKKFEVRNLPTGQAGSKFEVDAHHTSHIIHHTLIIGGNIGKNKSTPNEDAWKDYEICFKALHDHVDFFVVNVSSPNTPGLRELQEKESLRKILANLQLLNTQYLTPKPILLKIAPDLTQEQVDDVINLSLEIKLDGLVATNTTLDRSGLSKSSKLKSEKFGAGGLSGLPMKKRSTELVQYIHQKTNGLLPIIASGGILNGKDAKEKIDAGASLVQVWTGFIYEGPGIVKNISTYLTGNI
jgi:dihydroorotate dehydrogenase